MKKEQILNNKQRIIDMKKILVIFSGYNQRAVIAFLRILKINNVSDYCIVAIENDDIFKTEYRDKVIITRKSKELTKDSFTWMLNEIKDRTGAEQLTIVPSTEGLIRFVLDNREAFLNIGCSIPVVEKRLYETISDKYTFYKMCQKSGMLVPKVFDFPKEFTDKYVAKARKYTSVSGHKLAPVLVNCEDDHRKFLGENEKELFFCEEYIEGKSIYLLFYFTKSGEVIKFSQINYVQQNGGGSMIAAECASVHEEDIANRYIEMLKKSDFTGLIMIELRQNSNGYYMIEANPRLWGPMQLLVDAHVTILEAFLMDNGFINSIPEYKIDTKALYYWSTGIEDICFTNKSCSLLEGSDRFFEDMVKYRYYDLYNREDTKNIFYKEAALKYGNTLLELYLCSGKHSGYQKLNKELEIIVTPEKAGVIFSKYEYERLDYILRHVKLSNKKIADIGCNTGFFSFESIKKNAKSVDCYEGNRAHAGFVKLAGNIYKGNIRVFEEYFDFEGNERDYDIVLCLNVIHHLGDDFLKADNMDNAKHRMISCINAMAFYSRTLVLQFGFNWMGDPHKCLFEKGTKTEMIEYLKTNTESCWNITSIGVATGSKNCVEYKELDGLNIERDDTLGEFLNRPIFIMESKRCRLQGAC